MSNVIIVSTSPSSDRMLPIIVIASKACRTGVGVVEPSLILTSCQNNILK